MESENDGRVHFSEVSDPWSSSRHVAVLQELDAVEQVSVCVFTILLPFPSKPAVSCEV